MKTQITTVRGILPLLALAGINLITPQAKANVSICDAVAGNIVQNCGFELGAYSSTIGGSTDNSVPVDWVPNGGFDLNQGFNHVATNPNSGAQNLSISNFDYQPLATLSQTLTDISGATYQGSFFAFDGGAGGDSNAFLDMQVDGVTQVALDDTVGSYTQYFFSFTGSGSDTLTIAAQTNPDEWYVDDVVVTTTPDPSEMAPLALGMVLLLCAMRRKTSGCGWLPFGNAV